jgi:eukaryotic-like serine/threonine-protein kinase
MGMVYEVHDRELDLKVALKILHDGDGDAIEKLKHEFRVAADVRHENLVRLGELFEHEHRWCFSMELVDGVDLITFVSRRPKLVASIDAPTAPRGMRLEVDTGERRWDGEGAAELNLDATKLRTCLAQLAAGLAALHGKGIVHRDVKPSNIRVRSDGRVVLLDLGLAAASDQMDPEQMAGTAQYMAPEQTQSGVVTGAADMYAVGAILYEALVGRPPFIGPNVVVITEKCSSDPIQPQLLFPEIPEDLDKLAMALLARDPAARPTAEQVAKQLEAVVDAKPARQPLRPLAPQKRAFVGREQELKTLLRAGERSRSAPTVRVITGASGIGKTRLLGRFVQACRDYGIFVCFGRCRVREHVRLNAWEALLDGLTRMLSSLPRAECAALLPDDAESISRLFPIFARVLPVTSSSSLPAAELERRALVALRALLRKLALGMNVVVVIDDVQWATPDSLALFAQLLEPPDAPPLALVLGLRTTEAQTEAITNWLGRISEMDVDLSMMALGPLEPNEAKSLAQLLVNDKERAERIAKETGGHPLFLELLATQSQGSDALHRTMRRTVKDLAPNLLNVLALLAVAGAPVRIDLLGAALERDPFVIGEDLRELLSRRLVSVTGLGRHDHVEPFHAQVAEATLAVLPPETIRHEHVRLANALERMPFLSPERRALHWAWAGEAERAAREAIALATASKHALEYARAADVCSVVLALELGRETRAALARAYAEALAGSGHAKQAAIAYREAAELATGDQRLDLERRAAENFLRSGANVEGLELAGRVTEALGYDAKLSPGATIAQLLVERARLRLRGLAPKTSAVEATLVAKSDACYSLSTGFAMVDAISGALYQTRSTRFALDAGDPGRAARALAIESCFVSAWGSSTRARAGKIIDASEELAAKVGDPIMQAVARCARGICELQWGDFTPSITHCDESIALFREHGTGVVWEERTADVFAIWGLAWRGDWGEVARRCKALARAGEATGDRFATMHAAIAVAVCGELAHDRPAFARSNIEQVMAGWPRSHYDLPQVRELVGLATIATYEGNGTEALRLLDAQWKAIERSRMLGLEPVFATLADLRIRAALLAGDWPQAKSWAKKLQRVPWGVGVAALTRAALAAHAGNDAAAIAELTTAERVCTGFDLQLHVAAALDRRGRLVGGDQGAALRERAAGIVRDKEIRNPQRALTAIAPWPADLS